MTRYSDNILSGFQAITSALSSQSAVVLRKTHRFTNASPAVGSTQTGVFPPNAQNLTGSLYIIVNGSATVSDKITVSAAGVNLITFSSFGSAGGFFSGTTAGLGTVTVVASAAANVAAPTSANNGGEIPYSVTFLPSSASRSTDYQLILSFNRADTTFS